MSPSPDAWASGESIRSTLVTAPDLLPTRRDDALDFDKHDPLAVTTVVPVEVHRVHELLNQLSRQAGLEAMED